MCVVNLMPFTQTTNSICFMKAFNQTLILKIAVSIILIMHSVPGMFSGGVNDFGNLYLNKIGFAPFGLLLAWLIKLSHVATVLAIFLNKLVTLFCSITILILIVGIVLVHFPNGWFVVGGGFNGVEYNFLLIAVFSYLIVDAYKRGSLLKANTKN
jgi:putative oxidoreductase